MILRFTSDMHGSNTWASKLDDMRWTVAILRVHNIENENLKCSILETGFISQAHFYASSPTSPVAAFVLHFAPSRF